MLSIEVQLLYMNITHTDHLIYYLKKRSHCRLHMNQRPGGTKRYTPPKPKIAVRSKSVSKKMVITILAAGKSLTRVRASVCLRDERV